MLNNVKLGNRERTDCTALNELSAHYSFLLMNYRFGGWRSVAVAIFLQYSFRTSDQHNLALKSVPSKIMSWKHEIFHREIDLWIFGWAFFYICYPFEHENMSNSVPKILKDLIKVIIKNNLKKFDQVWCCKWRFNMMSYP